MKYPQLVSGRAVSGVSDWLSAELEALGIDGPLYSRLLLSLLHRPLQINVLDLVELHCVNRDREGRRARKRSRPPGSTVNGGSEGVWLNTKAYIKGSHWDPDILKRCAAVECLRTASDQKSDIEKLVDELCAKLREIENESSLDSLGDCPKTQQKLVETAKNPHDTIISPTELANKYYAAFPALSDSEITFYPSCHSSSVWSAPIKKNISNLEKKHFDKKAKMWKETDMDRKQKPISKKAKNKGVSRRSLPPQWDTVWELGNEELLREYINNQCNVRDRRDEGNSSLKIEDNNKRLYERDLDDVHFNQEWILEDDIQLKMNSETDMDKMSVARFEAKFNENVEALWKDADDNSDQLKDNECSIDELNVPVDIQDLLSSPSDLLFLDTINKLGEKPGGFIQAGTNILNSIWSDNVVLGNEEEAGENLCEKSFYPSKNSVEAAAEYKLEMARSFWENSEIETKELKYKKSELKNEFKSVPWQINFSINDLVKSKWSDDVIETQPFLSLASLSSKYQILNHDPEVSAFQEVIPRSVSHSATKTPPPPEDIFPRPIGAIEVEEPEEDLLNSDRTHFKPIKDAIYADGATFEVPNALAKVNYIRSESGTLSLETEHETKQYMMYRTKIPDFLYDDLNSSGYDAVIMKESVLAFCVKQIDKSCQTDDEMNVNNPYAIPENKVMKMEPIGGLRKREKYQIPKSYLDDLKLNCGCNRYYKCMLHKKQLGNYDDEADMPNFDNQNWCNKCCNNNNNNNIWRDQWFKNEANAGGMENLQQIWSNRVSCETCSIDTLSNDKKHYQELKKELSRDGEEIMSDLNYMQSLYIGSDWADDDTTMEDDLNQDLATSEAAYDVNKVITNCHQIFQQFKPTKTDKPISSKYFIGSKQYYVDTAPPPAPPESEQWKSGSDRKRRHSSSQRPCNETVSAECKKPHCKFSHESAAMPCPLWGDSCDQYDGECGGPAGCQYHYLICPRPLTR